MCDESASGGGTPRSGTGAGGEPHTNAGAGSVAAAQSSSMPSGTCATALPLNGDALRFETEVIKAFLDEWESEWPLRLAPGDSINAAALPRQAELSEHRCRSPGTRDKKAVVPQPTKRRTSSNTWWQQQRLAVQELRAAAKTLALQLHQLQLNHGVTSSISLGDRVRVAGARSPVKPLVICTAGSSWKDMARRESLARQIASTDNERLRNKASLHLAEARRLRRVVRRMLRTHEISEKLGVPRTCLRLEAQRPPTDDDEVFARLLAGLDDSYANTGKVLESNKIAKVPCPGKTSRMWVEEGRGLQTQVVDRYRMPFSYGTATRTIWEVISGRGDKDSKVLYAESFDLDPSTNVSSQRLIYAAGSQNLELLFRVASRKYVERERMVFVEHMTMVVTPSDRFSVTSDSATTRVFKRGELQTHVLASHPSADSILHFSAASLRQYEQAVLDFNHTVEDVVLAEARRSGV